MNEENKKDDNKDVGEKRVAGISLKGTVYSILKKASVVGFVYLAGYLQWSVAWLIGPVALLVIRDQYKKESERRRDIAKASALTNEKDVILARIDDLPAWVYFPDVERAEWINKIFKQCWPNVNHYVRELIRDKIQHILAKNLDKFGAFKFERIILGSVPPRIGGIKVYDANVPRSEIIMDLDLFYAGDCDINFTLQGIKGGIKDFQLHGMLRVVLKPLITTMPIVGGLQVFFLNNPSIDFNLVGVVDVLDMPGLGDMLRRIVVEQIAAMMVLPNKLPIKLSDTVEAAELKIPEPEGVLRVHVIEAKNLMKKDIGMLGKGKSDPYAVINVGAQEFRTKTIQNTVDPKWDYWCEAMVSSKEAQLVTLNLWDWDPALPGTQSDDPLGRATIEVANIAKKGSDDMWITLEKAKHGMVHVRLTWLKLSKNYSDLKAALEETQYLRVTSMSTALLTLYIDSARNLPQARTSSKPDPYVTLTLYTNTKQTAMQKRTSDPVWEEGFTFLVTNPETDTLYIKIMDQKTGNELGLLNLNLSMLADKPNLEIQRQPFGLLKGDHNSKIIMSMHLRILKQENDSAKTPLLHQASTISTSSVSLDHQQSLPPSEKSTSSENVIKSETGGLVEEEIIPETSPIISSTPPSSGVIHRTPSMTSSSGESGLGRIQLTLRYSVQRQRLIVVIHQIANLPLKDPSNIPDPYVKLYLLPDRSRETKRKTVVVKDNCNPIFDESFEYLISQGELSSQQLEVTVCTQKQLFYSSTNVMGQVIVDLSQFNLTQPINSWFDLQPEKK
nr:extended synaptotagmin-2 isoform X1 [Onthophagus taurus]